MDCRIIKVQVVDLNEPYTSIEYERIYNVVCSIIIDNRKYEIITLIFQK